MLGDRISSKDKLWVSVCHYKITNTKSFPQTNKLDIATIATHDYNASLYYCIIIYLFTISVQNSFGPMSRDVHGLVQGLRALWDGYMFDLDPSVVPMTFDEEVSTWEHYGIFDLDPSADFMTFDEEVSKVIGN